MGATEDHIHTQDQIELARLFKALGHPARIAIIENLLNGKDLNCKELGKYIQLAQSTISAHIKVLFDSGVLGVCVMGNNACYQVDKTAIEIMTDYLDKVFQWIDNFKSEKLNVYCKPFQKILMPNFNNSV